MAYTLIATQTLVAPSGTVTFSNIPGTFKDLVLECSFIQGTGSSQQSTVRVNGDSGTNYSITYLDGNGSSASSGRITSDTQVALYFVPSTGTSNPILSTTNFQSYANTSTFKTWLTRQGSETYLGAYVSLWRSTAAVTSLTINSTSGGNILAGSTFKLWGVS